MGHAATAHDGRLPFNCFARGHFRSSDVSQESLKTNLFTHFGSNAAAPMKTFGWWLKVLGHDPLSFQLRKKAILETAGTYDASAAGVKQSASGISMRKYAGCIAGGAGRAIRKNVLPSKLAMYPGITSRAASGFRALGSGVRGRGTVASPMAGDRGTGRVFFGHLSWIAGFQRFSSGRAHFSPCNRY